MNLRPKRLTPIGYRLLIRVFEREGFAIARRRGDHIMMTKPGARRPVVIKTSPRLVPVSHILANLRTAELTRERFFDLLEQVS